MSMMMNNGYNNFNPNLMGQTFTPQQPQHVQFTQPLTTEDVNALRKTDALFSLKVPADEMKRAICTHKVPGTSKFSVVMDGSDMVCTICGARMTPDEFDEEKVKKTTEDMINMMQCSKLMYVTAPPKVIEQFFAMIPFLNKFPQFYKIAMECYKKYSPDNATQNVYSNSNNLYNSYREIINGGSIGYPPMGGMNQPMFNGGMNPQQYPQYGTGYPQYSNPAVNQQQYQQPYPNMNNMGGMNQPMFNGMGQPEVNPFYSNGNGPVVNNQAQQPPAQPPKYAPTPNDKNKSAGNGNPAVERVNATGALEV